MRERHWTVVALVVAVALAVMAFAAQSPPRMESTIFSFDGKDFIRAQTTLLTEEGKPAVNTRLEHDNPAYKALMQKHSYVGPATVFGKKYDADYAPLTDADGRLTGALFVAVAK